MKGRFSDTQVIGILRQAQSGVRVSELCHGHGTGSASFYKWRSKFAGTDASVVSQMKAMADKNRRLKRKYAEIADWLMRLTPNRKA